MAWDIFISHATEDKETVVRPLASLLLAKGINVWLDELELKVGDSLRERIDEGLRESRYGIVVLSRAFFSKDWPQRELNGLLALESSHKKTILPVWHEVEFDDVRRFSPILADRLAVKTSRGLEQVAREVLRVLQPLKSKSHADATQIDWDDVNAKVARYLKTKKSLGTNYLTFNGDAEEVRSILRKIGAPTSNEDHAWQQGYYEYLGETSFIRQEYADAASAYDQLSTLTDNKSFVVAAIACLACGLQMEEGAKRASNIFDSVIGKGTAGVGINLPDILDSAVSLVFGEYFSVANPLLLVYGNDEGRLKDNLERAVDAFYGGLVAVVGTTHKDNKSNVALAFGQTLLNLAVPTAARKYLLQASDYGANVAADLQYADQLIQFGYENARIASLRHGERLPVNADMELRLSHKKSVSRLSAVFGKYIEGAEIFEEGA